MKTQTNKTMERKIIRNKPEKFEEFANHLYRVLAKNKVKGVIINSFDMYVDNRGYSIGWKIYGYEYHGSRQMPRILEVNKSAFNTAAKILNYKRINQ